MTSLLLVTLIIIICVVPFPCSFLHNTHTDTDDVGAQGWVFDKGFCTFCNQYRCVVGLKDVNVTRKHLVSSFQSIKKIWVSNLHLNFDKFDDIVSYMETIPCHTNITDCPIFHPWKKCIEGPIAAPNSHTILNTTRTVEVLSVQVPTRTREPFHTHHALSLMLTNIGGDSGDGQRYYDEHDQILWETKPHAPNSTADIHIQWMLPEWFHSIENTGPPIIDFPKKINTSAARNNSTSGYHALRFMFLETAK